MDFAFRTRFGESAERRTRRGRFRYSKSTAAARIAWRDFARGFYGCRRGPGRFGFGGMVRAAAIGADSPADAGSTAQRDSVGHAGAVHGLAAFLAARGTGDATARRARDAGSNPAAARIRSARKRVGTADFATAGGGIRVKGTRSTLLDGCGGMGPAFA